MAVTDGPADLTIFTPTRGRPKKLAPFVENFRKSIGADTKLVIVLDEDDPELDSYVQVLNNLTMSWIVAPPTARGMVGALNFAFGEADLGLGFAVGFMGDDHFPRTQGWDAAYLLALRIFGPGFVYGDDLFQHEVIPTQVAMTTDIPRTLGWMVPPQFHHLFVDVVWRDLGSGMGSLTYLPDVIVEHMHPLAGKARMDKAYAIVNNTMIARHDQAAYQHYIDFDLKNDVAKLKALQ